MCKTRMAEGKEANARSRPSTDARPAGCAMDAPVFGRWETTPSKYRAHTGGVRRRPRRQLVSCPVAGCEALRVLKPTVYSRRQQLGLDSSSTLPKLSFHQPSDYRFSHTRTLHTRSVTANPHEAQQPRHPRLGHWPRRIRRCWASRLGWLPYCLQRRLRRLLRCSWCRRW